MSSNFYYINFFEGINKVIQTENLFIVYNLLFNKQLVYGKILLILKATYSFISDIMYALDNKDSTLWAFSLTLLRTFM